MRFSSCLIKPALTKREYNIEIQYVTMRVWMQMVSICNTMSAMHHDQASQPFFMPTNVILSGPQPSSIGGRWRESVVARRSIGSGDIVGSSKGNEFVILGPNDGSSSSSLPVPHTFPIVSSSLSDLISMSIVSSSVI